VRDGGQVPPRAWVPVRVNEDLRPSRLVKSVSSYVIRSMMVIVRIFMLYRPLRFFALLGSVPFALGFLIGLRWLALIYLMPEPGRTYIPSLILAATLMLIGFQTWILGFVADLMAANRMLLEETRLRLRRAELDKNPDTD